MTTVEIEYCVPCCLLEYAIETQETLLKEFGRDLDEAAFLDELRRTVSDDGLLMEYPQVTTVGRTRIVPIGRSIYETI